MGRTTSNPPDKYKCLCGFTARLQYTYAKHLRECPINPKKPRRRQINASGDYFLPTNAEKVE